MLTPSAAELLAGVADALAATVLPELAPGPARRQVQAAIGITRRLAGALPRLGPSLAADVADVAATLTRLADAGVAVPDPAALASARDVAAAAAGAAADGSADSARRALPSLDELGALDRRLQEWLAEVADGVARAGGPAHADAEVRGLLARMLARETELGLSPWDA